MHPLYGLGRVSCPNKGFQGKLGRRREISGLPPKPSGSGFGGKSRSSGMSEFSPIWAETRDVALATTMRRAGVEEKQEKDLALYCARSITTARSAGSLREWD